MVTNEPPKKTEDTENANSKFPSPHSLLEAIPSPAGNRQPLRYRGRRISNRRLISRSDRVLPQSPKQRERTSNITKPAPDASEKFRFFAGRIKESASTQMPRPAQAAVAPRARAALSKSVLALSHIHTPPQKSTKDLIADQETNRRRPFFLLPVKRNRVGPLSRQKQTRNTDFLQNAQCYRQKGLPVGSDFPPPTPPSRDHPRIIIEDFLRLLPGNRLDTAFIQLKE